MTKFINTLGDKLLSKALRTETAGACIPEVHQQCSSQTYPSDSYCSYHRIYEIWCYYTYSCTGSCGPNGGACFTKPTGIQC